MKKDQQGLVKASLEALSSLEEAIKVTNKTNLSDRDKKRMTENMLKICKLTEKAMDCGKEELEKIYEKWAEEFEDRTDMLIGQSLMAVEELSRNK